MEKRRHSFRYWFLIWLSSFASIADGLCGIFMIHPRLTYKLVLYASTLEMSWARSK